MSNTSINETYIIEGIGEVLDFSACTAIFTNALKSCSGNTTIELGENLIVFNGNTLASIISATTYYGDGSNLTGISTQDTYVTGGTYNENNGVATFTNNTGGTFSVTGFYTGATDIYITAVTFTNNLLTLFRNDGVSFGANINNFTSLNVNGPVSATTFYGDGSNLTGISTQDTFVTGGTYLNGTSIFTNNTGGTFSVTGFYTGYTLTVSAITDTLGYIPLSADTFVTGGTYNNGIAEFINNTGGTFNISGFTTPFTGGTVDALIANTISATTYYNLPLDVFVTGGTYSAGTAVFVNNTGSTFSVSGFSKMLWYAENTTPPTVSPTSVGLGSIVFGDGATSSGSDSFVFGSGATSNGNNLNVFGTNAGQGSVNPNNSNFFGVSAGQSSYQADNSNFLGQSAGSDAQYAKYSNFFGYQVGSGLTGSNNIIIGTNITLPNSTYNAINLGNVLFGINTYSGITGTPNADPTIDGKIGIGVVTPLEKLHVGGNTLVDGGLTATTISATTYLNIPNTAFTGGTVTGGTRFTNGLTANTISASTYNLNTINNFSLVGNGNITISGGTSVTRRNENNSTNDAINYCGIALGTNVLDSAAAWTITRITVAVDGSVTTAISAVNSIWNNRESISYT